MSEKNAATETEEQVVEQTTDPTSNVSAAPDAGDQVADTQEDGGVKAAKFAPLGSANSAGAPGSIDLLLDVDLDLSVELGRTTIPVREVLQLGPGSIVELQKLAGESVDIMVNGKLIAKGEVVVVEENFGVRVIEIASPAERLGKLA